MDIRKDISSPANPRAPSFLNTLLPEIRNTIYEVLFKRDEPVLLHNTRAFEASPPDAALHKDVMREYHKRLLDFNEALEAENSRGRHFIHEFQLSTPFLRTCRQIYSEAIGVLYGHNTFIFTRLLHRHDYADWNSDWHNHPEWDNYMQYFPVTYAARWLSEIGSNFKFLNKVEIDLGSICPHSCSNSLNESPLWLLVEILWKHSSSGTVSFSWREPSLSEKVGSQLN